MFEDRAKRFASRAEGGKRAFDEQEFLYKLQGEVDLFRKNQDKISHLRSIELEIRRLKEEHEEVCPKGPGTCPKSNTLEKCLFFIDQELGEIVDVNLNQSYFAETQSSFSEKELIELSTKIDEVLNRLQTLGYGQEIIFNEIDELKELSKKLTKKDFNLILLGKLFAFGEKRLLGERSIQELFASINDSFNNMIG